MRTNKQCVCVNNLATDHKEFYDIKFNKLTRLPGYDINNYLGTCNNSKYIIIKFIEF